MKWFKCGKCGAVYEGDLVDDGCEKCQHGKIWFIVNAAGLVPGRTYHFVDRQYVMDPEDPPDEYCDVCDDPVVFPHETIYYGE